LREAPLHDIISDPHDGMIDNAQLKICGTVGRELLFNLKQEKFSNQVDTYRALFNFMGLYAGHAELWDLIDTIINKKEIRATNKVLHVNDIAKAYFSKIQNLETAGPFSFLGTALAKKEDRLAECAKMYLKLGDVKQYCEIMISLNQWEKAIAYAPYVSIEYWQNCVKRYADELKKSASEDAISYQLLANDTKSAVDNLLETENYENAKLVKVLSEAGVFFDTTKMYEYKKIDESVSKTQALNASVENMRPENRAVVVDISHLESEKYLSEGEVVLSAASELAIGNLEAAVVKLIRGNELFLAYFVAKLLKVPALDQINYLLGQKLERMRFYDDAYYFYKNSRNPRAVSLFVARNKLEYSKYGLTAPSSYAKNAGDSHGADAVFYNILAGNLLEASKIAIEKIKNVFNEKRYDLLMKVIELNNLMQNCSISNMPHEVKADLLFYGSYIGFFRSLWLGYIHVMQILLLNCQNIESHTKTNHGINYAPLEKLQKDVLEGIREKGVNKLEELVEAMTDKEAQNLVKGMLKAIREEYSMGIFVNN